MKPSCPYVRYGRYLTSLDEVGTTMCDLVDKPCLIEYGSECKEYEDYLKELKLEGMTDTPTLRSTIVAEEGFTFISLDASQIELRVLAILSQDKQMLQDLATGDLHLATAIRISQLKGEELTWLEDPDDKRKRRYNAKQINFAVCYGAGEFQIATMMGGTEEEALELMGIHRSAYPQLYQWMDMVKAKAKEDGYVVSMFGRIRPLPDFTASSWKLREKAEKESVNTLCQGTAVDIVKLCMIQLRREILDPRVRIVLQVHDEILLETPDDILNNTCKRIQEELPARFPNYPFSLKVGKNYAKLEEASNG